MIQFLIMFAAATIGSIIGSMITLKFMGKR